jgi:adenylosuccinate lyase
MPFMATERWLMLGVERGGDRQALHEVVRQHSLAVAESVAAGGANDLLERLGGDPAFAAVPAGQLRAELDPRRYTGRSEAQVHEFLREFIEPLLGQLRPLATAPDAAEVRV